MAENSQVFFITVARDIDSDELLSKSRLTVPPRTIAISREINRVRSSISGYAFDSVNRNKLLARKGRLARQAHPGIPESVRDG